jgi:short-subunit dehydrogenase
VPRSRLRTDCPNGARDRTALVTGATSGIGYEFAVRLASHGWDLLLVARSPAALEQVRHECATRFDVRVRAFPVDLQQPGAPRRLFEQLRAQCIEVDTLVNNAGFGDFGEFAAADPQVLDAMIQLNVNALTQSTHLALAGMLDRRHGRILNVASTAAFRPGPLMAVYSATKAYVLSFSEALASELEGSGVTVTALCPGPTRTRFHDRARIGPAQNAGMASAREVAEFGYDAMMRGRTIAIPGAWNQAKTAFLGMLPRQVQSSLVLWVRGRTRPAGASMKGGSSGGHGTIEAR